MEMGNLERGGFIYLVRRQMRVGQRLSLCFKELGFIVYFQLFVQMGVQETGLGQFGIPSTNHFPLGNIGCHPVLRVLDLAVIGI